jgi:hypothetical protein
VSAEQLARMVAGTGGPVGVTVDGRAVPLGDGSFPTYRWSLAPSGLATRRQLAAAGLRPGGAEPVARITWRRGRRHAYLFAVAAAVPKRTATAAQRVALAAAMRARRTCPVCQADVGYVLPRAWRECWDCQTGHAPAAAANAA